MENERRLPVEQKFLNRIAEQYDLWLSIVDESGDVSEEGKEKVRELLRKLKEDALKSWNSIQDACYYTISQMLDVVEREENQEDAKALYENIRDDIWAVYREMMKE